MENGTEDRLTIRQMAAILALLAGLAASIVVAINVAL
jgi:hypothetical protein